MDGSFMQRGPWQTDREKGFHEGFEWGVAATLAIFGIISTLAAVTVFVSASGR